MSSTIVLTSANCVNPSSGSNTFVYTFPTSVEFKHHEIALQSVSTAYSWFNISASLGNNVFSFQIYPADAWAQTYQIVIPDGAYNVSDINSYFKYWSIANGLFMINAATGVYSYLASFAVNATRYAVEIQTFPFVVPDGWALADGFPLAQGDSLQWNPVLTFPSAINLILGFPIGFATDANSGGLLVSPTPAGGTVSSNVIAYISSVCPQLQPNPSVLISCSGILNKYSSAPILHAFTSAGTSFGNLILDSVSSPAYSQLTSGTYSQLRLQFLGVNYLPLELRDPNTTILLTIKET
jgi:hypothetical protein